MLGADHDVWSVNVEEDYHEEKGSARGTGRDAPILPKRQVTRRRDKVAAVTGFLPSVNGLPFRQRVPRRAGGDHRSRRRTADRQRRQRPVRRHGLRRPRLLVSGRPSARATAPPPGPGTPSSATCCAASSTAGTMPGGPVTYLTLMNPLYPDGDHRIGPFTVHGRGRRMAPGSGRRSRRCSTLADHARSAWSQLKSANPLDVGQQPPVAGVRL